MRWVTTGAAACVLASSFATSSNGEHVEGRVSRRGLAIQDSWIVHLMTSKENCAKVTETVTNAHSRRLQQGDGASTTPVVINEFCSVLLTGSKEDAEVIVAHTKEVLEGEIPEISKLVLEQDAVVESTAVGSYGIDRVDQLNLPLNNFYTPDFKGDGVNIYIVDTGLRDTHTNFGGRAEFIGNFIDNIVGDDDGHGTHCAGTAASNDFGVAPEANVFGIRVLGSNGGSISSVVSGINLANQHAQANGGQAGVISMSLGGGASSALDNAVRSAATENMIVVVAAGNDSADACNFSPARAGGDGANTGVFSIGSTDQNDVMSSFSNFGGGCVDLFAPGTRIVSTFNTGDNAVATLSGTSMACPHVSGAFAGYLEKHSMDKEAAIEDLLASVALNKLTNVGPTSPNKLLQVATAFEVTEPVQVSPTPQPTVVATVPPAADDTVDLSDWTCPNSWFDANDGCDCSCGAPIDPDCFKPETTTLFCRGRGARFFQVCSAETGECITRWSSLEADATPSPTFVDQPSAKPGLEGEFDDDLLGNIINDVDEASDKFGFATIGVIAGVAFVAGLVALVVVRRRRKSFDEEMSPSTTGTIVNPQYHA
mmetsp:Transcript_10195/g.17974  ORF Transcript_10195/g.17974 Transcript_10195/m.17974 type:complete len:597 (-) Transcript_10195:42-1832(-)